MRTVGWILLIFTLAMVIPFPTFVLALIAIPIIFKIPKFFWDWIAKKKEKYPKQKEGD